jgi:hypothetical protein
MQKPESAKAVSGHFFPRTATCANVMGRPVSVGLLVYSLKLLRTSFYGVILYAVKLSVGVTCHPIHANGLMADRLLPAVSALISPAPDTPIFGILPCHQNYPAPKLLPSGDPQNLMAALL